jgi:hypothetical protein
MFMIMRVLGIAACAYAGSAVASNQFPNLPDCNQTCAEIAPGTSLLVDRTDQRQFWR